MAGTACRQPCGGYLSVVILKCDKIRAKSEWKVILHESRMTFFAKTTEKNSENSILHKNMCRFTYLTTEMLETNMKILKTNKNT